MGAELRGNHTRFRDSRQANRQLTCMCCWTVCGVWSGTSAASRAISDDKFCSKNGRNEKFELEHKVVIADLLDVAQLQEMRVIAAAANQRIMSQHL